MTACQWCDSTDTYVSGYSPMCVETQYRCRECGGDTYHDDRPHAHTRDARHNDGLDTNTIVNGRLRAGGKT